MHLDYWGLSKHPFSNVPDPHFYFDKNDSVQRAVENIVEYLAGCNAIFAAKIAPPAPVRRWACGLFWRTNFMLSNVKKFSKSNSAMPDIQPLIEDTEKHHTGNKRGEDNNSAFNSNVENISFEIKPDSIDGKASQTAIRCSQTQSAATENNMSYKELEELASRLATERIKSRKDLNDAFEAWEEVRNNIVLQLMNTKSATPN